ncbi:MAG: hypothetical protein CMP49_05265 [Flavobacteriales bacterium]|nr:hypothetical protein [Flavobacteriales bacterium]
MNKIEQNKDYKINLFYVIFFIVLSTFSQKNDSFDKILTKNLKNDSFSIGEQLRYKISYGKQNKKKGILTAGHATFEIKKHDNNNYLFHGFGKTTRMFSLFMKVQHEYKSIANIETLNLIQSEMTIEEGKFFIHDSIKFDSHTALENSIHDILTTFYKIRTIAMQDYQNIDTLFFSYYYNGEIIPSYIVKLKKELVQTKFGTIKTTKWSPLLEKGRMFKESTGAFIWVTDDAMHIPVKIEFPILVGSIYVNIIGAKGTMHNLNE